MSKYNPWCFNTLPVIFDDQLRYNELTPKIVNSINHIQEDLKAVFNEYSELSGDLTELNGDYTLFKESASEDIAGLKTGQTVKIGTFTPLNCRSNLVVRQVGNVVSVYGYVDSLDITNGSETTIGTLSEISPPDQMVRSACVVSSAAYSMGTMAYLGIAPNGNILVNTPSGGGQNKIVYFSVSYIA